MTNTQYDSVQRWAGRGCTAEATTGRTFARAKRSPVGPASTAPRGGDQWTTTTTRLAEKEKAEKAEKEKEKESERVSKHCLRQKKTAEKTHGQQTAANSKQQQPTLNRRHTKQRRLTSAIRRRRGRPGGNPCPPYLPLLLSSISLITIIITIIIIIVYPHHHPFPFSVPLSRFSTCHSSSLSPCTDHQVVDSDGRAKRWR